MNRSERKDESKSQQAHESGPDQAEGTGDFLANGQMNSRPGLRLAEQTKYY